MPKSKKPRKQYKPKLRATYRQYFRPEDIQGLKETFTRIENMAEITLPLGRCTADDVSVFRDYLNTATTLIGCGHHVRKDFWDEYGAEYSQCLDRFETYLKRTLQTNNYTATADEIKGIRRGIEIAGAVINAEFDLEPAWVLDCYRGTKQITDKAQGKQALDQGFLNRQIKRIAASSVLNFRG